MAHFGPVIWSEARRWTRLSRTKRVRSRVRFEADDSGSRSRSRSQVRTPGPGLSFCSDSVNLPLLLWLSVSTCVPPHPGSRTLGVMSSCLSDVRNITNHDVSTIFKLPVLQPSGTLSTRCCSNTDWRFGDQKQDQMRLLHIKYVGWVHKANG